VKAPDDFSSLRNRSRDGFRRIFFEKFENAGSVSAARSQKRILFYCPLVAGGNVPATDYIEHGFWRAGVKSSAKALPLKLDSIQPIPLLGHDDKVSLICNPPV
jgi:hypothetical protein